LSKSVVPSTHGDVESTPVLINACALIGMSVRRAWIKEKCVVVED
jgi:hypothetical protein